MKDKPMKKEPMTKWLPLIAVAIFACWFLGGFEAPKPFDGFDLAGFGRLPVLNDGRIQPLDSVARNSLLSFSGRSTVHLTNGEALPFWPRMAASMKGRLSLTPMQWLAVTMTRPDEADKLKIFRVQHPDLEGVLGADKAGLEYYSLNDLTNQWDSLYSQARKILASEAGHDDLVKLRTPFQKDLIHLFKSVMTYLTLKSCLEPEGTRDFTRELQVYQDSIAPGKAALEENQQGKPADEEALQRIAAFYKRYDRLAETAYPTIIPPLAGQPRAKWSNTGEALMETLRSGQMHPAVLQFAAMADGYHSNNPAQFNQALASYRVWMHENQLYPELKKGGQEYFFSQIEPFYKSMVIYAFAMILGCLFWVNLWEPVRRTGFALLLLAFVIHSLGLGFRMYLEGRPPVTNLYSSAIFIGWGACLFGLCLEKIFKGGIGLVVAGLIGFITLIIAHFLALSGDTMEMLQAVLDTNLWLATHVVIVTTGYASMFVAGILAIIYITRGFFTRNLTAETARTLGRMVYGIVCFATLFSFVGTILGGIWADQSWGRFWGWDPKENGALLIVLWNAVILHARWGGMIKERGLMAMAVFGNIITSFSWFGVNMLGIGLHSYGFMDKAFPWLVGFDISQALLVVVALMPLHHWASFQSAAPPGPPAGPPQATPSPAAT
jgi:ABC-type transport system involved in cytochrome c biogenesis permease subunit